MIRALLLMLLALFVTEANASTTLLPNGSQCFSGPTGPLANGSVDMFIPNTTTPKATWKDSGQLALNTQPIQLDGNGCAVIYGIGSYRQRVFDGPVVGGLTSGAQIWDQVTTDTSSFNSIFWAGNAAGTPNAITVTYPGFNGTDGTIVNFTALATNTTSATVNPSGFGNVPVLKDTTGGPVSLVGGEIVINNAVSVIYRTSDAAFHLLNPPIQSASGTTSPRCGSTGLRITNSVGTPNTIMQVNIDEAVMSSGGGTTVNRQNLSFTINISLGTVTSTAGGMDGEAPNNSWINLWAIDNGSGTAGLASIQTGGPPSASVTSPNLPSGYIYKCRIGAVFVNGPSTLIRFLTTGRQTRYLVAGGQQPITNSLGAFWSSQGLNGIVPPTAVGVIVSLVCNSGVINNQSTTCAVAPNNSYSTDATLSTNPVPPISTYVFNLIGAGGSLGGTDVKEGDLIMETNNIFTGSAGTVGGASKIIFVGWIDKVNAS